MNHSEIQADLAKVAAEYNHSAQQQAILENYKDSILLLRAKYASYEKIAGLLNEHGITVSVATVRKFCRKHTEEMQRLRTEIEADVAPLVPKSEPTPSATKQDRPPLTTEPGKRGPRQARDTL